jgi:hypothetical protein
MHFEQKVWPQTVGTGRTNGSKHIGQFNSNDRSLSHSWFNVSYFKAELLVKYLTVRFFRLNSSISFF